MKIRRRIMALLLSAAMVMTFLPAMAYADPIETDKSDAVSEAAADENETGVIDADENTESENTAVKDIKDDEPGDQLDFDEGGSENQPEDQDENDQTEALVPVSAKLEGSPLRGVIGSDEIYSYAPGIHSINVTFSDDSEKRYVYCEKKYEDDEEGYTYGTFVYAGDTASYDDIDPMEAKVCLYASVCGEDDEDVVFTEGWNYNVRMKLAVDYIASGEGTDNEEIESASLYTYVDVLCVYDRKPLSVKFVPAEGYDPVYTAGIRYIDDWFFAGEGNAFVVSYEGWMAGDDEVGTEDGYGNFTRTYYYTTGMNDDGEEVSGFFYKGDLSQEQFMFSDGIVIDLPFGEETELDGLTYTEYVKELDEYVEVPFTYTVKATKYEPYTKFKNYKYTGKIITPSFKVYYDDDVLLDPEEYEVSYEPQKKMGWYNATITFKDKEKFVESITAGYSIGPQAPVLYKPVAGKKRVLVKWKKPTATQLKNLDGYYIELSTDKNFDSNYKIVKVSKKVVKSGRKYVKGLKKGRKYYVRISAYKKIKQNGESDIVFSNDSKIKVSKKTR